MVGIISFFNDKKGYGFVEDDAGKSFFFHRENLRDKAVRIDTRIVGQRVSFDLAPAISRTKPSQAVNVALLHATDGLGGVR
jgi:cold shock CspA family protein